MASGKVIVPSKAITKKKEKANKKLTWTDQDTDVFAEVIYDPQYRGSDYTVGWATVLERLALKKSSNVKIFEEIQEALKKEFEARKMKVKEFTVEQLRSKYKWFKREWKHIQNKIKFGSGLSSKETECTRWYDTLNPVFTEGVDEFTDLACSAGDIAEERSFTSVVSVHASSGEEEMDHSSSSDESSEERSTTPLSVPEGDNKLEVHHGGDKRKASEDESNKEEMKKEKKVSKKPKIGLHPKRDIKPKTQTAAVLQLCKTMETYSQSVNHAQDERLNRILEADRKRDEMFLKFQQEQAEANRRHEQLMMQLVLQNAPSQSLPLTSQQYYPFQEQKPHNPSLLAFTSATPYVSPQHGLYSMPSETDSKGYYSSTSPGGTSDYTQLN